MKVLVCGSRNWFDEQTLWDWLDQLLPHPTMIIHGDAPGADYLAGLWAKTSGIIEVKVPAQWAAHGKAAGPMRNGEMLRLDPDFVVAFPLGESRGTKNMMMQARRLGVPVIDATQTAPKEVIEQTTFDQESLGLKLGL